MGLSARVREATRTDHAAAQAATYFDALLAGHLDRHGYAAPDRAAVLRLRDAGGSRRPHVQRPVAGPFVLDGLARLPCLAADLEYLLGADWRQWATASASTSEYQARLCEVAFTWRAVKRRYRQLLDAVPWDSVEQDRFLDEVSLAYRLNVAMLDDLGKAVRR